MKSGCNLVVQGFLQLIRRCLPRLPLAQTNCTHCGFSVEKEREGPYRGAFQLGVLMNLFLVNPGNMKSEKGENITLCPKSRAVVPPQSLDVSTGLFKSTKLWHLPYSYA